MESYNSNGRNSYGRNMNDRCNQNRQMNSYGRQMSMAKPQMSMSNRQMPNCDNSCSDMRILPISDNNSCDCGDDNHHMSHMALGIGYVPMQEWGDVYDIETAHCQGTIFPDLNLIFCGARGKM